MVPGSVKRCGCDTPQLATPSSTRCGFCGGKADQSGPRAYRPTTRPSADLVGLECEPVTFCRRGGHRCNGGPFDGRRVNHVQGGEVMVRFLVVDAPHSPFDEGRAPSGMYVLEHIPDGFSFYRWAKA